MSLPTAPVRSRPKRVLGFFRRTAITSIIVGPLAIVIGYLGAVILVPVPAVAVTNAHEDDSIAVQGGTLNIVVKLHRVGFCPTETQRYMWRMVEVNGTLVAQFVPLIVTIMPLVSPVEDVMLSLTLPPQVTPGLWFYQSLSIERCSMLPANIGQRMFRSPNVEVNILAPAITPGG